MRYVPYLIAKNIDGRYEVIFNPDAPPRLGMILHGDKSAHSPYDTPESAKARAESIAMAGGFTALNVDLVVVATTALGMLECISNGDRFELDTIAKLIDLLRLALPSVTPDD